MNVLCGGAGWRRMAEGNGRDAFRTVVTLSAMVLGMASMVGAEDDALLLGSVVVGEEGTEQVPSPHMQDGGEYGWSQSSSDGLQPAEHSFFAAAAPASHVLDPRWNLAVDALMLWQGNAQSLPLLLNTAGGTALNAQNLQTEMGAGARVGLIREVGDCHAIEGNYFQARPFDSTGYAPASGGPYTLTTMGDVVVDDVTWATKHTSGWIQSAELNWRKNVCYSPITWLAGFRWVELNSSANVDYNFSNLDPDAIGTGSVSTDVGNNLYGGQMGADIRLWNRGGRWRANAIGKAGVFYNSASYQRSSGGFIKNDGQVISLGTVSATADQAAFFGEIGLNSTYWITNWLAWRAGYVVMWASGVAVAPQQFPLNNFGDRTATINTESSVLLHGATTGIEARW